MRARSEQQLEMRSHDFRIPKDSYLDSDPFGSVWDRRVFEKEMMKRREQRTGAGVGHDEGFYVLISIVFLGTTLQVFWFHFCLSRHFFERIEMKTPTRDH